MTANFNNNNINLGNIQPTPAAQVEKESSIPAAQVTPNEERDLSQHVPVGQAALVGKSQIKSDNIASDLAAFCANPKKIEQANQIFDMAYEEFVNKNIDNPYEKACLVSSQYVNEVSGK